MTHHLRCVDCGWEGPEDSYLLACPRCTGLLEAVGLAVLQRPPTPLFRSEAVSERLGVEVWFKDETVHPTGTMKDREAWLAVQRLLWHGIGHLVMWSSGNAGSAVAREVSLHGSRIAPDGASGMTVMDLVVPLASEDRVKSVWRMFDRERVHVRFVAGGNDEAAAIAAQMVARGSRTVGEGGFRNYARREGLTGIGRELLATPYAFDWYVQAVTGGLGVMAIEKACRDAGRECPRVLAVQPSLCAPMYSAWVHGADELEERFIPQAKPISPYVRVLRTRRPDGYRWVKRVMDRVDGRFTVVTGGEIREALRLFYADDYWKERRVAGVTVGLEPATALAGLMREVRAGTVRGRVVVNVSGAAKGDDVREEWIEDVVG